MTNKLIVLSMDAMVTEDLEYLKNKPNFRKLFEHAASVGKVRTIYPSLTYPAHTSIITGCRPGKHGIFDNNRVGIKEQHDDLGAKNIADTFFCIWESHGILSLCGFAHRCVLYLL